HQRGLELVDGPAEERGRRLSLFLLRAEEERLAEFIAHHVVAGEVELADRIAIFRIENLFEKLNGLVEVAVLDVDEAAEPGHGPPRRGRLALAGAGPGPAPPAR